MSSQRANDVRARGEFSQNCHRGPPIGDFVDVSPTLLQEQSEQIHLFGFPPVSRFSFQSVVPDFFNLLCVCLPSFHSSTKLPSRSHWILPVLVRQLVAFATSVASIGPASVIMASFGKSISSSMCPAIWISHPAPTLFLTFVSSSLLTPPSK